MNNIRQNFLKRTEDVRHLLQHISTIEPVVATTYGPREYFYSEIHINTMKANAVVMIYGCVEYAFRYCIVRIREEIMRRELLVGDLHIHWRQDFIQTKVLKLMREGSSHTERIRDISSLITELAKWSPKEITKIMGSNIGGTELSGIAKKLDIEWNPPKESRGAIDLEYIRITRNSLTHGDEEFWKVGSQIVTADLFEKLNRIEIAVTSFIETVSQYLEDSRFIRQ